MIKCSRKFPSSVYQACSTCGRHNTADTGLHAKRQLFFTGEILSSFHWKKLFFYVLERTKQIISEPPRAWWYSRTEDCATICLPFLLLSGFSFRLQEKNGCYSFRQIFSCTPFQGVEYSAILFPCLDACCKNSSKLGFLAVAMLDARF